MRNIKNDSKIKVHINFKNIRNISDNMLEYIA